MPTEDHSSYRSHQDLPQGGADLSLDELAKGLATGTLTRGKALRLMGAALVGGALASIPGIAWAKPNKPEGAKCKHGFQCASGQCVDGRCFVGGCPATQICGDACCAAGEACWSGVGIAICCSEDPPCVGDLTLAGQQVCIQRAAYDNCDHPTCSTDADCSSGEVCVQDLFCDPQNRCLPTC